MTLTQQQAQELKELFEAYRIQASGDSSSEAYGAVIAFIDRLSADSVGAEPVAHSTCDELSRENDGSIAIDWITKDRDMLTMSLAKDGTLSWAVHRAGPQGSGTAQLNEACFWTLNQCLDEAEALAAPSPAPAVPSELVRYTPTARGQMSTDDEGPWVRFAAVQALLAASQQPAATSEPTYLNWNLHPRTADLVLRFSYALAGKLAAAEKKYGYSDGWAEPDWMCECRDKLMEHIDKGDPRDVAAYCAFLWHHGESTTPTRPTMRTIADIAGVFDEGVRQGAALAHQPAASQEGDGK